MRHTDKSTRYSLLSVKLPASLQDKIAAIARRRGSTVSAVVRDALEAYEGEEPGSFTERAQSACGVIEGPADLSTNPEHLAGYGR